MKAVKDIAEKTITQLPALTGASTYTAWEKGITKLVEGVQDGKQLTALAHARAFIDHNIPLPQKYMELPSAEFDISTATMAELKLRKEFQREWRTFREAGLLEGIMPAKLETKPMTPSKEGMDTADPDSDDTIPLGADVEVLLEPTAKQEDAAEKGGEASDARWILGRVIATPERTMRVL